MAGKSDDDAISWTVLFLAVLFGSGTWLSINALWVELPLLVASGVPEGYTLGSYIIIITQLGNLGPLLFTAVNYFSPRNVKIEVPTIYILIIFASMSTLMMIFFWDETTYWEVDDKEHSTILLILTFIFAAVACTTPVTYVPFMSRFPGKYLMYYFIGEGFSALLPSILALIQGVGEKPKCVATQDVYFNTTTTVENTTVALQCKEWVVENSKPRFSSQVFFASLFVITLFSSTSFILLNVLPVAKYEQKKGTYVSDQLQSCHSDEEGASRNMLENANGEIQLQELEISSLNNHASKDGDEVSIRSNIQEHVAYVLLERRQIIYLLVILGWVNAIFNSILPSIQTYSCGPYGMGTFHLAASIDNIIMPVMYLAVSIKPQSNIPVVYVMTFLLTVVGSYCMLTAVLSPSPPLQFSPAGDVIVVLAWMIVAGLFSYVKATIGWILRSQPNNHHLLLWFGVVTQIGSFLGAAIIFPLVSVFHIFEQYYEDPCEGVDICV